jgi:hypothetical protein
MVDKSKEQIALELTKISYDNLNTFLKYSIRVFGGVDIISAVGLVSFAKESSYVFSVAIISSIITALLLAAYLENSYSNKIGTFYTRVLNSMGKP